MKKFLSIILALAVIISSCAVFATAYDKFDADEVSDYPLIIVPGYSSSSLCLDTGEVIWGLNMDEVLDRVLNRIMDLGMGLGALTVGNADSKENDVIPSICSSRQTCKTSSFSAKEIG